MDNQPQTIDRSGRAKKLMIWGIVLTGIITPFCLGVFFYGDIVGVTKTQLSEATQIKSPAELGAVSDQETITLDAIIAPDSQVQVSNFAIAELQVWDWDPYGSKGNWTPIDDYKGNFTIDFQGQLLDVYSNEGTGLVAGDAGPAEGEYSYEEYRYYGFRPGAAVEILGKYNKATNQISAEHVCGIGGDYGADGKKSGCEGAAEGIAQAQWIVIIIIIGVNIVSAILIVKAVRLNKGHWRWM
ncbi:hypothetical protein ACFL2B_00900 [Patescibacteria group bacterium]